jgi:predicted lipoprotein
LRNSILRPVNTQSRRELLQFATGSALLLLLPACRRTPKEQRERVLAALVEQLIVPDTRALVVKSRKLETSLTEFVRGPSDSTLLASRAAFRSALLAWEAAACFKSGPLLSSGSLLRVLFWPTKAVALDSLVQSRAAIDQLSTLAVDQKGLFAIEHLLFPVGAEAEATQIRLVSREGERSRWLLCGLSRLVTEAAHKTSDELRDGASLQSSLLAGEHESIKLLLNNIGSSVSSVITDPGAVLRDEVASSPTELRGGPSHSAFAIASSRIAAAQRLYSGEADGSLAALVKDSAPEVHAQVETEFARALSDLRALPERVAPNLVPASARRATALAVHALEVAVKNDLANALGVPLLFGLPHDD